MELKLRDKYRSHKYTTSEEYYRKIFSNSYDFELLKTDYMNKSVNISKKDNVSEILNENTLSPLKDHVEEDMVTFTINV